MDEVQDARRRVGFPVLPALIEAFDPMDEDMRALTRLGDWYFSAMRGLARDVRDGRLSAAQRDAVQSEIDEALAGVPGLQLVSSEGPAGDGDGAGPPAQDGTA